MTAVETATVLEPVTRLVVDPPGRYRVTHLDTFDWRLWNRGVRLTVEQRGRERLLHWRSSDGTAPYVIPVTGELRWAEDVPPGWLRSELAELLDIRALMPLGETKVERQLVRVVDGDDNTMVRLWWEEISPVDANRTTQEGRRLLRVEGLSGHEREHGAVIRALRAHPGVVEEELDHLSTAVACRGREPGDYSSKVRLTLDAKQRADDAMVSILLRLLEALEANVEGVVADIDTEFLHDLRVACRRTRSALAQLKGVLTPEEVEEFAGEFKWLGTLTGPCRDLDVYQMEMHTYREMLPERAVADLAPLEALITRSRQRAHQQVVRGVRSARFRKLLDRWQRFLESDAALDGGPEAGRAIRELANERITKAYRRILKRGGRLSDDPPAEALHRLRIDAKKLRYLLEFFRSLYPARRIDPLIKELKRLQDILGGFNDMEVQQERLSDLAEDLLADGGAHAGAYIAMGRLQVALEQRQEEFRLSFHKGFTAFANAESRAVYARLFRQPGRKQP